MVAARCRRCCSIGIAKADANGSGQRYHCHAQHALRNCVPLLDRGAAHILKGWGAFFRRVLLHHLAEQASTLPTTMRWMGWSRCLAVAAIWAASQRIIAAWDAWT